MLSGSVKVFAVLHFSVLWPLDRTRNKLWYFEFGTLETLRSTCKNLTENIEIEASVVMVSELQLVHCLVWFSLELGQFCHNRTEHEWDLVKHNLKEILVSSAPDPTWKPSFKQNLQQVLVAEQRKDRLTSSPLVTRERLFQVTRPIKAAKCHETFVSLSPFMEMKNHIQFSEVNESTVKKGLQLSSDSLDMVMWIVIEFESENGISGLWGKNDVLDFSKLRKLFGRAFGLDKSNSF